MNSDSDLLYAVESMNIACEAMSRHNNSVLRMNMSKWLPNTEHNVLYITGVSGSGKSTEGLRYAAMKEVIVFHLDAFTEFLFSGAQKMNEIIKNYPNDESLPIYKKYFDTSGVLEKFKDKYKGNVQINKKFFLNFFKWLQAYTRAHKNKLFVIEGIHLYIFVEPKEFINETFICIMPSKFRLSSNMLKRAIARDRTKTNIIKIMQTIFNELHQIKGSIAQTEVVDLYIDEYLRLYNKK